MKKLAFYTLSLFLWLIVTWLLVMLFFYLSDIAIARGFYDIALSLRTSTHQIYLISGVIWYRKEICKVIVEIGIKSIIRDGDKHAN